MNNLLFNHSHADRIKAKQDLPSKKRVIETLSHLLADSLPEANGLLGGLLKREKLGTTALGNGVAIPHTRAAIDSPKIAILTLKHGIEFDAPDDTLVDVFFAIAVPENNPEQHLSILADLAKALKNTVFCEHLRHAKSNNKLHEALILGQPETIA